MAETILTVNNLSYTYQSGKYRVQALKGISFTVNEGEIFGFIGPNGAGKTTTIKHLLGILTADSCNLSVFGKPPSDPAARAKIGYMPEIANYYDYLTPVELLYMYGRVFGIDRPTVRRRIYNLLGLVDLQKESGRLLKTFSKGMMQRVSFAQALINDPDLLILDEPTGGLDPVSRKRMREVIQDLKGKGKTVFFSSHELSEVELISDRIGVLHRGELLAEGGVKDILEDKQAGESLEKYFLKLIKEHA